MTAVQDAAGQPASALAAYVLADLDDTLARWRGQVLDLVPAERRGEHVPEGSSVRWASFHVTRHAALALEVLGADAGTAAWSGRLPDAALRPGAGLQEVAQPWAVDLDDAAVDAYAADVFARVREVLAGIDDGILTRRLDVPARLAAAGIDDTEFGWLVRLWDAPVAFLVRWPLTGHVTNHVGEMIGIRNQFGLSPFR